MSQLRVLARTVKGLEELLADQLARHGAGVVERFRPREVLFKTGHGLGEAWPGLRVADDAFVVAGVIIDDRPETGNHLSRYGLALTRGVPVSLHGRHPRIQRWRAHN